MLFGTTWYVDNSCTNNGDGTAQSCAASPGAAGPFNSIANAQSAITGDQHDNSVLLKATKTFREQYTVPAYGTSGHPFTVGAYSTGAAPILNETNLFSSWSSVTPTDGYYTFAGTSGQYLSTPATVANELAGITSARMEADVNVTQYETGSQTFINKDDEGSHRHYRFEVGGGSLVVYVWDTGAALHAFTKYVAYGTYLTDGVRYKLRADITMDNGSGGSSVTFYYSTDGITYTPMGAAVTGTAFSALAANDTPVLAGDTASNTAPLVGTLYRARVWSGLGTTLIFDSNVNDNPPGATTWVSSGIGGETWTNNGATAFTPHTGANVWKKTGVTTPVKIVVFDGTVGNLQDSVIDLGVAEDYYYDATYSILYVYAASSPDSLYTNPGVEVGQRDYGVLVSNQSYVTVQGLTVTGANLSGAEALQSGAGTVDHVVFDSITAFNNTAGITTTTYPVSAAVTNFTISNCTVYQNPSDGIMIGSMAQTGLISNCVAHDNAWNMNVVSTWPLAGIHLISTASTRTNIENVTVEYVSSYSNGSRTAAGTTPGGPAQHGFGIYFDTVTSCTSRYNTSYGNWQSGITIENNDGAIAYYNLSYLNGGDGLAISRENINNQAFNNVVYDNANWGIQLGKENSTPAGTINNTIQNNISVANAFQELRALNGGENDGTYGHGNVFTYNAFGPQASTFIQWGASVYKSTYGAWETAAGNCGTAGCTHSVQVGPQFVNVSANNFILQPLSPACYSGTNVGLTQDILGRTIIPGFVSMGAYQCQPSVAGTGGAL
jgi:hypothetical protein